MMFLLLLCLSSAVAIPHHPTRVSSRIEENCGYESCNQHDPTKLNVHIVAHTHDDVGWLKTVDQYYYGSRNVIQKAGVRYILDSVVKELWADPNRRFVYIETAFFWKWWEKQSKETMDMVHTLVRQGRLQFSGGAWSMNDEADTHYQSTVDQFTYGLSKLNQTFGKCGLPRVGWQIDPFGHSREFASLLSAMGYDGVFFGRIDFQDIDVRKQNKTMEMLWRGDDDLGKSSDIFAGVLYNQYQPPSSFCFDIQCSDEPIIDDKSSPMYNVETRVKRFLDVCNNMSRAYATNNVLVTMGGDFNYMDAMTWFVNLDKLIEYTNLKAAKEGLNIKLLYSTPQCYLKAVKDANPVLPTKEDDFFPYASSPNAYWTGFYTSRPTVKYFEREGNNYLQMVKQLQLLGDLYEGNMFVLDELKAAMGVMQHHDAVTGTEQQHVANDYERILNNAIEDSLLIVREAFNKFMFPSDPTAELSFERCHLNESSCDVSENSNQFIVTVYNHLAWQVNDSIRIPVVAGNYEVYAPNSQKIVSQIVEIPKHVQNLPTRHSRATHEIVFIAYLHPLSYKSYYITKTSNKKTRKVNDDDFYMETHDLAYEKLERIQERLAKASDRPILSVNVMDNAKYIKHDNDVKNTRTKRSLQSDYLKTAKPSANNFGEDDQRMMGDDPHVVQRSYDEWVLENQHLNLHLVNSDEPTLYVSHSSNKDREISVNMKYGYYKGWSKGKQNSGAYIFRPQSNDPDAFKMQYTKGDNGNVVKEIHLISESMSSTIRLYAGANYIEVDWVAGPIPIDDNVGKEYIVRYETNLVNNGEFYTDSNGRQMLKRKLGVRPQFDAVIEEPVAGNYYPVTSKISIKDNEHKVSILTDRAQGGTSLNEGDIELMLHRRLLVDDNFGVAEPLNETVMDNKIGLVARGRHRIFVTNANNDSQYIDEKKHMIQFHLQPQVFVSDAGGITLERWLTFKNSFSWAYPLPLGLHILTLEPWGQNLLLRLENFLETKEPNSVLNIDLNTIFKTIKVKSFRETTLAANMWVEDLDHWSWKTKNSFKGNNNNNVQDGDDGTKIVLNPKQIRTFIVDYDFVTNN